MTCDEGRPCQRCIKREIGHLCHDEERRRTPQQQQQPVPPPPTQPYIYSDPGVTLGNEFSVLTDFLETLDDGSFFGAPPASTTPLPTAFPPAAAATPDEILPSATKTERFLLTAADQSPGSRDERLNRVIRSKYEAGLLKPYNYVKGYARLSRWMDRKLVPCHLFHPSC